MCACAKCAVPASVGNQDGRSRNPAPLRCSTDVPVASERRASSTSSAEHAMESEPRTPASLASGGAGVRSVPVSHSRDIPRHSPLTTVPVSAMYGGSPTGRINRSMVVSHLSPGYVYAFRLLINVGLMSTRLSATAAYAAPEDSILGRDGNLPAGITPLSLAQQVHLRENGKLDLTHVQRAQLRVATLNSAPLTPPTVEDRNRWLRRSAAASAAAVGATSAILAWRETCVVSHRRFRPIFLDQVQWKQSDPRLAALAREASYFNAHMIEKYGLPFKLARREATETARDLSGQSGGS